MVLSWLTEYKRITLLADTLGSCIRQAANEQGRSFVVEGTDPVSEEAVIGNCPVNCRLAYRGEYDTPSITVRGCWL